MKRRSRYVYACLSLLIILLGLCTRIPGLRLPDFLHLYAGDALWAMMIFCLYGFLLPDLKTSSLVCISLAFCGGIEASQLYHAPWLEQLRHTALGGLVLGYGFLWSDVIAYSIGIGTAGWLEMILRSRPLRHRSG